MTYFGFLAIFLGIPILILVGATVYDYRIRGRAYPSHFNGYNALLILGIHLLIALIYTTPWDNYLVATSVWWYDPALVTGITIGYVPIEEYTFFIVQPIFTGLWVLFWMRRNREPSHSWRAAGVRWGAVALGAVLWFASLVILVSGWKPGTYLALIGIWALIPILVQFIFGADILWRHRRLVALGILPTTLYLAAADTLAIQSGTWTIDPAQSLPILLGGVLPIEEFIFFFVTNVLIVFGLTLVLAAESQVRLQEVVGWLNRFRQAPPSPTDA